jgi:hypothetical protein
VVELDSEYDSSGLTVQEFHKTKLIPRVDKVLEQLEKEDEQEYGEERRKMGIVMEYPQDDENDEESSGDGTDWDLSTLLLRSFEIFVDSLCKMTVVHISSARASGELLGEV